MTDGTLCVLESSCGGQEKSEWGHTRTGNWNEDREIGLRWLTLV